MKPLYRFRGSRGACVLAVLVAGMGLIGALQPIGAQELQPAIVQPINVDYGLLLRHPNPVICVGQTFPVGVTLVSQVNVPDDDNLPAPGGVTLTIESVYVEAAVNAAVLSSTGTPTQPVGAINNAIPLEGRFEFTGIAPGRSTIDITGEVRNFLFRYPVYESLSVQVIPCRLRVVTNGRWFQRLIGGTVRVYGVMVDGEMVGDSSGIYNGQGNVIWVMEAAIPNCAQTNTLHLGTVNMHGRLIDNDRILVELTFDPLPATEAIQCSGVGGGGGDIFASAAPLRAVVPIYGGVTTLPQRLTGSAGVIRGRSTVYISPLAD